MQNLTLFLWVAVGGGLGTATRFALTELFNSAFMPTMLINILGSGLMGYLFILLEKRLRKDGNSRLPENLGKVNAKAKPAFYEKDLTLQAVDHFRANIKLSYLSAFLLTGFLGGFTTFSAYSLFNVTLLQQGNTLSFLINLVLTPVLAFACFLLGCTLALKKKS
jgi:CrcB protein